MFLNVLLLSCCTDISIKHMSLSSAVAARPGRITLLCNHKIQVLWLRCLPV